MSEGQQTVVDTTDVTAQPGTEVTDSARQDVDALDALLAEYDQGTQRTAPAATTQTTTTTQPDQGALVQRVQAVETGLQEWRQDQTKRAVSETIQEVRGDIPADFMDDDMVEGWLDAQARKDPRLAQAFLQRETNPRQWNKVKAALGKQLNDRFKKLPDRQATDDREAVAAAVRGASTKVSAEPAPKFGSQSNAEFRKSVKEQYGFDPGV